MQIREPIILSLAMCSGFVGGLISTSIYRAAGVAPKSIQASRFELVDEIGRTISFWGVDSIGGQRRAIIAFNNAEQKEISAFGAAREEGPFLIMHGSDGKVRAALQLGWQQRPVLSMSDGKYEGRVLLGSIAADSPSDEDDDWGLVFRGSNSLVPYASIGMTREPKKERPFGLLSVHNREGRTWTAP